MHLRKYTLTLLFLSFFSQGFTQAIWSDSTFVHRSNRDIFDGQNNKIRLEGVNLGGWLLWESWIWGNALKSETDIYTKIKDKLGEPKAVAFRDSVHANYIRRRDIELIAEQCYNVVRVPFNHTLLEDDAALFVYKQSGWNLLDSLLAWCEDNNVYVVLDLHSAPGGQSNYFTADPSSPNLWESTTNKNRTIQLWKTIVNRYKNRGIIAGYDFLNEPAAPSGQVLVDFYKQIIDTIRTVDNNHMLFIEGKTSSTDFTDFTTLLDQNMVYAFHFYSWFTPNIQNAINKHIELSINQNVPVWCGEWGENDYATLRNTLEIYQNPESNISGEAFWTWKKSMKGSNYPSYVGIYSTPKWDKTITWITTAFAVEPTQQEMETGMQEFIYNMKAEHTYFNEQMNITLGGCKTNPSASGVDQLLRIYPNPAYEVANIVIPDTTSSVNKRLVVTNFWGKQVDEFFLFSDAPIFSFDVSQYVSGVYFLTYYTGDAKYKGKILVVHP